ncbi:hypothetical protein ACIPPS_11950 [Streptomyces sp. NPDC090127]|uniref:hypothetical protein n=1 Tax=Streptomyces sp. NPDC090127 TaxID=3365953 RepID=UPI00380068DC
MDGKNFSARKPRQDLAAFADTGVHQLAQRITHHVLDAMTSPGMDPRVPALTRLLVLEELRQAAERLQRVAAAEAARAGAGYPQLGEACGMTRQGARRRWPGLLAPPPDHPTEQR